MNPVAFIVAVALSQLAPLAVILMSLAGFFALVEFWSLRHP